MDVEEAERNAKRKLGGAVAGLLGVFSWLAGFFDPSFIMGTEGLWFSLATAYERYLAPTLGLPSLGGLFVFVVLVYAGLKIGDLINARNEY